MKHFGIYANTSDVQDALNAGTLENPYVATVQGNLDYNTIEQQTCDERGLCGDDPTNCHECSCQEQYSDPADICNCEGGYYWGDECHDEPEPEEPCVLGEWSDDGEGNYTFQILDTGDTAWMNTISIAQLFGLYPRGDGPYDMDVSLTLTTGEPNIWNMEFHVNEQSDMPQHDFYDGSQELWNSGAMVDPNESNSSVDVNWDGVDTFTFSAADLNINTINPECSEEGPSE